jgi:hypothetical protein
VSKRNKGFFSSFSVVADINRNLEIAVAVVCGKGSKILKRIKSFTSVADNYAKTFAFKNNCSTAVKGSNLNGNIGATKTC